MRHILFISLLILITFPGTLFGQSFSIDGNRWYEVEISIFTNQSLGALNSELALPARTVLRYPEQILQLKSATSSLEIDFNALSSPLPLSTGDSAPGPVYGPVFSPVSTEQSQFRIQNFDTDPFIALGSKFFTFANDNQTINSSDNHRLLFHGVWRQPMLSKNQSTAVFIKGGQQYGLHSELEGSVTLSYNINRVDIETNLWRNSFTSDTRMSQWPVPPPPFINNDNAGYSLIIESVSTMNEVRPMISNELHYLDHPDFGLLVEVRPYQLPEEEVF